LVSIGTSPLTVIKSTQAYDEKIIGVVSVNPYLAMGPEPAEGVKVALLGRVPTKVSLEAGLIEIGDYLVASSLPGVAMKATKSGRVIGQALQPFEGVSIECEILITTNEEGEEVSSMNCYEKASDIGKIMVLVNPGWLGGEVDGAQISQQGVTIYDKVTGEPYCLFVEGGVLQTAPGACGSQPAQTTQPVDCGTTSCDLDGTLHLTGVCENSFVDGACQTCTPSCVSAEGFSDCDSDLSNGCETQGICP